MDIGIHCLQAEIVSAYSQIQNGRQEVTVTKYNLNKRPKIPFKSSIITNLWIHKSLPVLFLPSCSYNLFKFKMTDKMAVKTCFYHNMRISAADLGNILGESFTLC